MPNETATVAVHPLDPNAPEAHALRNISREIADTSNQFVEQLTFTDVTQFSGESMRERIGRLIDSSPSYAHDLRQYWSDLSVLATDRYTYQNGDPRALTRLQDSFADLNDRVQTQLSAFDEATSPFQDDYYDADKIARVGAQLRDTLAEGIRRAHDAGDLPTGDQRDQRLAEIRFLETMGAALVGLSQQIGGRLNVLASGKTVDRITLSSQTQGLLQRAVRDPALTSMTSQLEDAEKVQTTLTKNDFSEDAVNAMISRSIDIQLMINKGRLTDEERAPLEAEKTKIQELLNTYHFVVSLAKKAPKDQKAIKDIQEKLTGISFSLKTERSQEAVVKLLAEFRDLQSQLVVAEAPFLKDGSKLAIENTNNLRQRQDAYVENLAAARQSVGDSLTEYWRQTKSDFLGNVESLSGSALKKTLDTAFDSGLSDMLTSWDKEASKSKLNAEQLQAKAADVLSTLDAYSNRAQLAFKTNNEPAKQDVLDDLQAKISALRQSVAERLGHLFEIGVFDEQ